ncbi:MAG: YgiT-type zinc finger protein [Tildeniella nuda ZEHNDER 1965/U140]|jgi:YgiT-type zinc finger domain-containing protein|nr:YgiT-type zinc finger protein [Tildeniella nuda ZEHNDER 1965/U140]
MMNAFQQCPSCGGELVKKNVQKLLRGGMHTAVLQVKAEVCLQCGERLYSEETVRRFEDIRAKLKNQQVEEFTPLGRSFQVS